MRNLSNGRVVAAGREPRWSADTRHAPGAAARTVVSGPVPVGVHGARVQPGVWPADVPLDQARVLCYTPSRHDGRRMPDWL